MLLFKVRNGLHLLWLFAAANLYSTAGGFVRGPRGAAREVYNTTRRCWLALKALVTLRGRERAEQWVRLCQTSGVADEVIARNPEGAFILAHDLISFQKYEDAIAVLEPHLGETPRAAKCYAVRGIARIQLGQYAAAQADLDTCARLRPRLARDFRYHLERGFLAGMRGDIETARRAMGAQIGVHNLTNPGPEIAEYLFRRIKPFLRGLHLKGSIGIVIGCYTNAVGHAILDPFHFWNLFRRRFDHLVVLHPYLAQYTVPTRTAVTILDPHVTQLEVIDPLVTFFAWQNLGELKHENMTFLLYNYWSLNRMAYQARLDRDHPMSRGRAYLSLPPKLAARAEELLRRNYVGIPDDKPVVVLHTREHGYHALRGQRYRNTDVRNYIPAVRRLIEAGYAVVRVGDKKMMSIRDHVPELLELPLTDFADPAVDAYFIARCRFMMSCQSGPCSIARVFGKPNLVVNAVYHYTLLPERADLMGFKRYIGPDGRPLSVAELLRLGAHLFDRTEHFRNAGVEVEDMTPDEILAATEEMLGWLDDPARPETPAQARFRDLLRAAAKNHDPENPLATPLTDYIGYALPECRVSDAVVRMRPWEIPDATPHIRAA